MTPRSIDGISLLFAKSCRPKELSSRFRWGSSIPMIRAVDLEHLPIYYIPLAQQIQYAERASQSEYSCGGAVNGTARD